MFAGTSISAAESHPSSPLQYAIAGKYDARTAPAFIVPAASATHHDGKQSLRRRPSVTFACGPFMWRSSSYMMIDKSTMSNFLQQAIGNCRVHCLNRIWNASGQARKWIRWRNYTFKRGRLGSFLSDYSRKTYQFCIRWWNYSDCALDILARNTSKQNKQQHCFVSLAVKRLWPSETLKRLRFRAVLVVTGF